jgi:hypothetical protein
MVNNNVVRKLFTRRLTKNELSLRRRSYGMTPNDVVRRKRVQKLIYKVIKVKNVVENFSELSEISRKEIELNLQDIFIILTREYYSIVRAPAELNDPLDKISRSNVKISSFSDEIIPTLFRYDNAEQLNHLFVAFRFPVIFRATSGHVFFGETILLAGLYILFKFKNKIKHVY